MAENELVLVTGGCGYIGSVAVQRLIDEGYRVRVLDDLSTGHADACHPAAELLVGSLHDSAVLVAALSGVDAVLHFAGKSLVGESVTSPDLYEHVNVEGSRLLLRAMRAASVDRFVFSSSAAVYGNPDRSPISENAPTLPTNPYGATKLAVDHLTSEACAQGWLGAASLRYFNVAGAMRTDRGWIGERHHAETHLVPNVLRSSASEPVTVFGTDWPTADGTCIRDYVHVVDLVDAHILALRQLMTGEHQIINLGSGCGYSVREVLRIAGVTQDRPIPSVDGPPRLGDPAVLVADIARAAAVLDWRPTRSLEVMIADSAAVLTD